MGAESTGASTGLRTRFAFFSGFPPGLSLNSVTMLSILLVAPHRRVGVRAAAVEDPGPKLRSRPGIRGDAPGPTWLGRAKDLGISGCGWYWGSAGEKQGPLRALERDSLPGALRKVVWGGSGARFQQCALIRRGGGVTRRSGASTPCGKAVTLWAGDKFPLGSRKALREIPGRWVAQDMLCCVGLRKA